MRKNRTKKATRYKSVIRIYCDGETEKHYLNSLKTDKYNGLTIEIKPGLGASDRFEDVFDEIGQLLDADEAEQYRRIFYLKDMDTVYNQGKIGKFQNGALKLFRKKHAANRLFIIDSRPCFEFWLLLHFDGKDRLLHNYEEVKFELCNHLSDYCKETKYSVKLYGKLRDKLEKAIKYSKSICEKQREPGEEFSYTFTHRVIEELDSLNS